MSKYPRDYPASKCFTPSEFGHRVGLSYAGVRWNIGKRRIATVPTAGKKRMIPREEIARFKQERRSPGRPRGSG